MNHRKWLTATAEHYNISEEDVLKRGKNPAKKTFYYLCFRDGIDLYKLAGELGYNRTSVLQNMYYTETRDVMSEREIRACVENSTIEDVITHWITRPESRSKEIVLTSLIAQKQHFYEDD